MSFTAPSLFTTRPTLQGNFGMAASTHWIGSASAMSVLEQGGNAFDAAVAAGFVLQVVEPHLNGIGGELVAIMTTGATHEPRVLAGTGSAPAAATMDAMVDREVVAMPGSGLLSAPVPGQFDAWLLLLRDYGTWELADVLAYAIHYARSGFAVGPQLRDTIIAVRDVFAHHWASSFDMWTPAGEIPRAGDISTNPTLAHTLERLVASAQGRTREARIDRVRTVWAEGFVAEEILRFTADPVWHSDGSFHPGLLAADDLARYRATYEDPVIGTFRGHSVAKVGAWSQGPALLQMLGILEGFHDDELDPSREDGAHVILEAVKLAMADRDSYLGGSGSPLEVLLSPQYLAARRALIDDVASLEFRPGKVGSSDPYIPPLIACTTADPAHGAGEPTVDRTGATRGDTCHVDVADRWGNIISATPSGGWLQSSPFIPRLGFALSTRLQQCWLDPDSPSALRPGQRPRITLTPTLVRSQEGEMVALGTPGGDGQDQWQLLYLLRTLVGGYTPQQAIDAPAFASTSFPDSFWPRRWAPGGVNVENRLGAPVIDSLARRGHAVTRMGDWSLGRLSSVTCDQRTGRLSAAANPRGAQGYAVGR